MNLRNKVGVDSASPTLYPGNPAVVVAVRRALRASRKDGDTLVALPLAAQEMGLPEAEVRKWCCACMISHYRYAGETLIPLYEIDRVRDHGVFREPPDPRGRVVLNRAKRKPRSKS